MSQANINKQTMQKQHEDASKHHQEAAKYHQEAAGFHKNEKHLEGFASANKARGHAVQAEQCASDASRHSAGIFSDKTSQNQNAKRDPEQDKKGNDQSYRPQQR